MTRKRLKKYIAGFFLLALFTFLGDRGFYYLLFNIENSLYSKNDFEVRFAKYMEGKSFSTLIFGTSRTYEAIHPIHFENKLGEKAFKEAFQGKGPKYNYYFYQLYKKYAGIPKVVIYGVDYFIYAVTSEHQWMSRFAQAEKRRPDGFFAAPLLLLKNKDGIDKFFTGVMNQLKERLTYQKVDKSRFKDIVDVQQYKGETKSKDRMNTNPDKSYMRQLYPKFPGKEGLWFKKLLAELKKDKVTVILVALPDYIGSYKTNFQRQRFMSELKALLRDNDNIHIFNYNRPKRFELGNINYFNDGGYGQTNSHLSESGALVFSKILAQDIEQFYKK